MQEQETKIMTADEARQLTKNQEKFLELKNRIMSEIMDKIKSRAMYGYHDAEIQLNPLFSFDRYEIRSTLMKAGYSVAFTSDNLYRIDWSEDEKSLKDTQFS